MSDVSSDSDMTDDISDMGSDVAQIDRNAWSRILGAGDGPSEPEPNNDPARVSLNGMSVLN